MPVSVLVGSISWSDVVLRLYYLATQVVWDIERGKEEFPIEGFNFAFIHRGRDEGRIASVHWIDEDGSLIGTVAPGVQRPTQILVKLWDIRNGISDRLFDVAGVAIAQFPPDGQYLAVEK